MEKQVTSAKEQLESQLTACIKTLEKIRRDTEDCTEAVFGIERIGG